MFFKIAHIFRCQMFFSKYQENNLGIHVKLEEVCLLLPENLDIPRMKQHLTGNEAAVPVD